MLYHTRIKHTMIYHIITYHIQVRRSTLLWVYNPLANLGCQDEWLRRSALLAFGALQALARSAWKAVFST